LKTDSDGDNVTERDKLFHARAAATGNARSPIVVLLVRDVQLTSRPWPKFQPGLNLCDTVELSGKARRREVVLAPIGQYR